MKKNFYRRTCILLSISLFIALCMMNIAWTACHFPVPGLLWGGLGDLLSQLLVLGLWLFTLSVTIMSMLSNDLAAEIDRLRERDCSLTHHITDLRTDMISVQKDINTLRLENSDTTKR